MAKILVYQLWPIAWGNIRLMTAFLPRIAALGADYVWLSPVQTSPWRNHGYDVADYYSIESRLGTLRDFDEFVAAAHALHIKVIMDLVIDSTSIEHLWFRNDRSRYIWSDEDVSGWENLFDQTTAWQKLPGREKHYLSLFHPRQADLNWYNSGVLNRGLVESFKSIMQYWLYSHNVDGFRVGSVQSLNRDIKKDDLKFRDIMVGNRSVSIVNELANLYGGKAPFLIMDCLDPTYGDAVDYYAKETDIEFITNGLLKNSVIADQGACGDLNTLKERLKRHAQNSKFMLELENHQSPRFTSRSGMDGEEVLNLMFDSEAQAICLYQGQELGMKNPNEQELSTTEILNLDARAALYFENDHATAESLRQNSWANARTPIPLDEYARQESDEGSVLNYAKAIIKKWHQRSW